MTLLYPLHQTLCIVLHHLTTTSLLTAELQLFSISLINVLILASSPQVQVLKALLWVGGLGILVLCGSAIRSGIVLARVPKWRFRKISGHRRRPLWKELSKIFSWKRIKSEFFGAAQDDPLYGLSSSEEELDTNKLQGPKRVQTLGPNFNSSVDKSNGNNPPSNPVADTTDIGPSRIARSHTLSYVDGHPKVSHSYTPSGRRKRAVSTSLRPFLKLTYTQAVIRKWLYALYVYITLAAVILAGIRTHMQLIAFQGKDPIGWALGYLFGDLPWFRFQVVNANLERWICLPARPDDDEGKQCQLGWVQHVRHDDFGEANTRLIIAGYWLMVIIVGLLTVFRLQDIYEVDTRRKVFHFMMVGMLLPATFIDPSFAALALSIVLGVFLILDLIRASQLPPLSKPIATFLAPYVDGRDFRGPVVISHIFLLIGCAIPLWLALAALPRTGTGYSAGWELPTRDVSMVSGVICVGLGDAAASLIGRRYGHRKWLWGGGKSLEGSVAFAVAVFAGLAAASVWLRVGGWPLAGEQAGVLRSARNAAVCSSMASLTEAVLTGGNDNVIVPVVLWTCVKSLAI
jgi:dolichol kinase